MNKHIENIQAYNENSWEELCWAISSSKGEFSLILAHCNSVGLQKSLTQKLQTSCPVEVRQIFLDKSIKRLYRTIQAEIAKESPQALIVFGLESVKELDALLKSANQVREEFRKNFPFPVVLWVTDEVMQKLIRIAHDLQTWATTVEFAIATDYLVEVIQKTGDEVFAKVLEAGAGRFLNNNALNLGIGSPQRIELELAQAELKNRNTPIQPELEAGFEFLLGRDIGNTLEKSLQHYERSLSLLSSPDSSSTQLLEKRACILYSIGLSWRTYAALYRNEREQACQKAQDYFEQCTSVFEQAKRLDLVANFINAWGEVLQRQEKWTDLEIVSNKALNLHQTYPNQFRLARAYGFLAEVMLHKSAQIEAKENAEKAIEILDKETSIAENSLSLKIIADLEWERSYHRGWYLFTLAKSQLALNEIEPAIKSLETAKLQTKHQYDPELFIWILAELRNCYFYQRQYLKAFHTKQEQRSLEQQYGFRAFVGAGRLQPKQQVSNPALALTEQQGTVAQEIAASGRKQDIKRFIERIGRHDRKLTIIHGQSGVGKSSILQAGLIPVLQNKSIGTRDVLPVLQQVYTDWLTELGKLLAKAIKSPYLSIKQEEFQPIAVKNDEFEIATQAIIEQLQKNADNQLLTVIIFDQFEEFFFVYKDTKQRLIFYKFLRQCLDVPHVRVILSLREDYLYYLLECNNRLIDFEVINNNILDKDILYYIGNFSPTDTKLLIDNLTKTTQLLLEANLIDALVTDLAGELEEVRPIELQVVGTQLQTEEISTLVKYQERGPKEELVARFLEEVVNDCGEENQQITKLVLYLLTDENNTRPLKTRADLEMELEVDSEKLDLILLILVKSGLIFKIPSVPDDRYQLVHDYLVPFVRQQQSARLIAELEKEREQRKLTEAKLNEVLKQQLLEARRGLRWKVTSGIIFGALAIFLPVLLIGQNNAQLSSMSTKSRGYLRSNRDLEALLTSLKASKRLNQWWSFGITPETRMQVLSGLQDVVYTIQERNILEPHNDTVTSVKVSPNNKMIASGTADGIVKIWRRNGKVINSFKAHNKKITNLRFSPDSKTILSTSEDETLKLWNLEGKKIATFEEHKGKINNFSFSSDGQKIVSASEDRTLKLWNLQGKEIKNFSGHERSVTDVSFSPDGSRIVSISDDNTLRLWNLEGKEINKYSDGSFEDIIFSPDSQKIATNSASSLQLRHRNGSLLKRFYNLNNYHHEIIGRNISFGKDAKNIAIAGYSGSRTYRYIPPNNLYAQINKMDSEEITHFTFKGHRNKPTSTNFSPDLKILASGSEDKTVRLWELKKSKFKTINNYIPVNEIGFSPNGQIVASVNYLNTTELWHPNGILKTRLPGNNSEINFTNDNQNLVTASQDSTVQIWLRNGSFFKSIKGNINDSNNIFYNKDNNTTQLLNTDGKILTTIKGYKSQIFRVIVSQNGETIATVDRDRKINVWHKNGKLLSSWEDSKNSIYSTNLSLSLDGKYLVWQEDKSTLKFLKTSGEEIKTLKFNQANSIDFSPDGTVIAITKENDNGLDKIELREIDGTIINTIKLEDKNTLYSVSFSSDSQVIIATGPVTIQFWKRDGTLISNLDKRDVAYSQDFQTFATFEGNNQINLWKRDGKLFKTIKLKNELRNTYRITSSDILFSGDGKTLAILTDINSVELWRTNGTFLKTIKGTIDKDIDRFNYGLKNQDSFDLPMSFSSDGQQFAIRTGQNEVKIWNIENNKISSKTIKGKGDWISSVKFIPNSDKLAISGGDDTVKIWQLPDKKEDKPLLLKTFQGHSDLITSVDISPENQLTASASYDKTVNLWRFDGGLFKTFTLHEDKVNSVSFSPDGKLIASASDDKTVKVWKLDGQVIKNFEEHGNAVTSVSFSPDGQLIASASKDNTVRIRNLQTEEVKTLPSDEPVTNISFSPDSKTIATATYKNIKLWSVDGTPLTTYERLGHAAVSFSPDGKSIAASNKVSEFVPPSGEGISVWDFDLDKLIKRGCNWARDYLKNNPNVKDSDRALCDDVK